VLARCGAAVAAAMITIAVVMACVVVVLIVAATSVLSPLGGVLGGALNGAGSGAGSGDGARSGAPSSAALADIPADYLALYQQGATACPGLDWSILAAIGKIESNHGRSALPGVAPGTVNSAGAGGPMQFLAPTFNAVTARHHIPPGGATLPNLYNPHDAIWAAAYDLCDSGAPGELRAALLAYNHAQWYVSQVLTQAQRYRQAAAPATPPITGSDAPGDDAAPHAGNPGPPVPTGPVSGAGQAGAALAFAHSQIGTPYVWGGNGPATSGGFDCSGLTHAALAAAGVSIPRTAQTQFNAGPKLPAGTTPQPGDLVFFGAGPASVTHVGIATSATTMIDAPDRGQLVRIDPINTRTMVGTTRPAG
jgi:cell wall-associated NlpC family hydrolase